MSGLYGEDLAYVHHTGWGGFARDAAPGIVARLRAAGIARGLVVDLSCGTGILARALTDACHEVLGVDLSPAMLAIAREQAPAARFVEGSVVDAELPPCVAVTAIGEGLGYLHDPRLADDEQLTGLFSRVRAALRPGGLFLFDLVEADAPRRDWIQGEDYVLCVELAVENTTFARRIVLFRRVEDGWRHSDETHLGRLQPRSVVLAQLARAGFRAEVIPGYAEGAPLRPGVVGYAALA